MKTVAATLGQALILVALGLAVGLGVNTVRGKNAVHLGRDYAPKPLPPPPNSDPNAPPTDPSGPKHWHQELTCAQVVEAFESPDTALGLNVFVDARNDQAFGQGHIPGAVQCDFYRLECYFDKVLDKAAGASRIIVYCNGGQCEDSLFVCGELVRAGIPQELIYLFRGGWEEWTRSNMPMATGRE